MPISLIAGNWKMNTTVRSAVDLATRVKAGLQAAGRVETLVCPPFVSLAAVAATLEGTVVRVGAQNVHHEEDGAYTGEVSASMLKELCDYVILGHSERRQLFGETDATVNLKTKAALEAGLKPIVCVGEDLDDREAGREAETVQRQLTGSLEGIAHSADLVVAYEPVWAIGTGRAATPTQAQEIIAHLRRVLGSLYGAAPAGEVRLLYGGSVNPANIGEFMAEPDVNGALVGGASLDAEAFVQIAQTTATVAGSR
jgi:triosephosphate isomerase